MVKNQIVNLTLDHSFDHNLSFKFPIGKCEHTFDICVLKNFQQSKKDPIWTSFVIYTFGPTIQNLMGHQSQSMKSFENVGIHFLALSHTCECALESWYILKICFPFHSLALVVNSRLESQQ